MPVDLIPIEMQKSFADLENNGKFSPKQLNEQTLNNLDKIKIIGIVGSRGKTTTAKVIHEYLRAKGFKSMLYSSAEIYSPAGNSKPGEGSETPLLNLGVLLRIIYEAEIFQPDYLVLEVNESSIVNGITKDIPFTVRVLTNIFKNHHIDQEPSDTYVNSIKSFFRNASLEEVSVNVFGATGDIAKEELKELLNINNKRSFTFGSVYTAEQKNIDYTKFDTIMHFCEHSLEGMEIHLRVKGEFFKFATQMIMPYNALNIICAITVLAALNIFETEAFLNVIQDVQVQGREEVFLFENCKVIVGMFLDPALDYLKNYQLNGEINKIRLVTGASGTGFKGWEPIFKSDFYISQRAKIRKQAMDYIKSLADFIYLTENDSAAEDALAICEELQTYLDNKIPSEIILNRQEAIKKAIIECEYNDVVFITGRGSRKILATGETEMKSLKDSEVVKKVMEE